MEHDLEIIDLLLKEEKDLEIGPLKIKNNGVLYTFSNLYINLVKSREDLLASFESNSINAVIFFWLKNSRLGEATRVKYAHYIKELVDNQCIPFSDMDGNELNFSIFSKIDHQSIVHSIESLPISSAAIKARIDCYRSFLHFIKETFGKTFLNKDLLEGSSYKLSSKSIKKQLSRNEWQRFTFELSKRNYRDYIIALIIFYGAKRINDVLGLQLDQIDFDKNIINFNIKKKGLFQPVSFPPKLMDNLKKYLKSSQEKRGSSSTVFVTHSGKQVTRHRLNFSLSDASVKSGLSWNLSPDKIRAVGVLLLNNKNNDKND